MGGGSPKIFSDKRNRVCEGGLRRSSGAGEGSRLEPEPRGPYKQDAKKVDPGPRVTVPKSAAW